MLNIWIYFNLLYFNLSMKYIILSVFKSNGLMRKYDEVFVIEF